MKLQPTFIKSLFLLFTVIFLGIACQKNLNFDNGNGGTVARKCISCSYLPVCDSSNFVFIDSTANGIDTNKNLVSILGDSTINGLVYNEVTTLGFFDNGLLYNCDGGDYKLLLALSDLGFDFQSVIDSLLQGLPIPPGVIAVPDKILVTALKANATSGTKWKDVVLKPTIPLLTLEVAIEHELIQKLNSKSVLGKSYSDVLEMKSIIKLNAGGLVPSTEFATLHIFYAKGVGIIEGSISTQGTITQVRKLYKYQL